MEGAKSFLQSKKAMGFLVGVVGLFLTQILGIDPEASDKIMKGIEWLVGAYIAGQSGQDIALAFLNSLGKKQVPAEVKPQ